MPALEVFKKQAGTLMFFRPQETKIYSKDGFLLFFSNLFISLEDSYLIVGQP